MKKHIVLFTIFLTSALFSAPASANTTYLGNGLGKDCFDAVSGMSFSAPSNSDIQVCTNALESGTLIGQNLPATYVNRGIIFMRMEKYEEAIADYDRALKANPDLAEAKINKGAALIGLRRYATAISFLEEGLKAPSRRPHVAHYNLGVAHELLGDYQTAREHYVVANEIAPDWNPALRKLESLPVSAVTPAQHQAKEQS